MQTNQTQWKRLSLFLLLALGMLFLIQIAYRSVTHQESAAFSFNSEVFRTSRKNYASYQKSPSAPGIVPQTAGSDKYEKIARLASVTSSFDEDRTKLAQIISSDKGIIQFESLEGLDGSRVYYLSAGIPPESFDATVEKLRVTGKSIEISIQKTDKTSEYLGLLEKRASLERTRASLAGLKTKGGSMDEFLKLENRLLEIDEQLQNASLGIGQFNAENEFCTVQFSLREKEGISLGSIYTILVDSFLWTLALVVMLLFFGAAAGFAIWLLLLIKERLPDPLKKVD